MNDLQKNKIVRLIAEERARLGSQVRVATKCGVSPATISQILSQKWTEITDAMWLKIESVLSVDSEDWKLVATTNYRMIAQVIRDAKQNCMFMGISEDAGSGKTSAFKGYFASGEDVGVYLLQAREWAKKDFLVHLCKSLGIEHKSMMTLDELGEAIIRFFVLRKTERPVLLIDEGDKLKPSALRFLITLYNDLEDRMGLVVCGTKNLEKEVSRGARYSIKGYDEIYSRLGGTFIALPGNNYRDIESICRANGIDSAKTIQKIWKEAGPVKRIWGNQSIEVIVDNRRVKRAIQREKLLMEPDLTTQRAVI